jgi:drug/metabolite transporter (DMT)-like permease
VKSRDLVMMLALAAIWGGSYLFIRVASPVFGPFMLVELRVLIAGIALYTYATATHRRPQFSQNTRKFLALGAVNGATPFTLIAIAELYIPASLASILNATTPLFAAIVAAIVLNDRFTVKRSIGLVVGVVGITVLVGWSPIPLTVPVILASIATLLASFAYGLGGTFAARNFKGFPPLTMAIGQHFGAAVAVLPFALASIPHVRFTMDAFANLLALALLSTAVAYLVYFPLLASVGPTKTLSVTFLIPVFGVLWGAMFLHEAIGVGTVVGMIVILSSVTLVTGLKVWPRAKATDVAMTASMPARRT